VNIYVGNLSRETTEETLRQAFASHGEVSSVNIIKDRYTGESREFGFVEMFTKTEAQSAISILNGTEVDGRLLKVNEARPRNDNRSGGGGWSGGRRSW
jgi:RNA recognition motif-containing protein